MNKEQLEFFYDEIMGELGWGDEEEETGVDPLLWVRKQLFLIRDEVKTWKVAEKMALETVAQLRAELDKKDAAHQNSTQTLVDDIEILRADNERIRQQAVDYALIVEQFQKLLGVYTTTSAFEKIAEKDAALEEAESIIREVGTTRINGENVLMPEWLSRCYAWLSAHPAPQEEK
jgi:hypothetical protein